MPSLNDYATQSDFSHPGVHASLLDALPGDPRALAAVVRNVIVHYRSGVTLPPERLAEINSRWVERILEVDQSRNGQPLATVRPREQRVAGCCRDFTLLTVAALRHQGVPARSRIGFAAYLEPPFHDDHVIVEYHDGTRWIRMDAQLDPSRDWGFDVADMPSLTAADPPFASAARVWTDWRAGRIDDQQYGVSPDLPVRGSWFIMDYVISELAHRQRDELLLWDGWGAIADHLPDDLSLIDEIASLLQAADGDTSADARLTARYQEDTRLRPVGWVTCMSPTGDRFAVDLAARTAAPVVLPDEPR